MVPKRTLLIGNSLAFMSILACPTGEAASSQGREQARSSQSSTRIIAGTVVNGDIDTRTLGAALEALPRRPERIVVVDAEAVPPAQERQLRELDAFVPIGSKVIYLRRQSATLLAGHEQSGSSGRRFLEWRHGDPLAAHLPSTTSRRRPARAGPRRT